MVILVVFNSFNVVQNLKKPDPVACQMPPLYTTEGYFEFDNGIGFLQIIFKDAGQDGLYDRIWNQIINNIDNNKTINDIKKTR